jgi:RHS repeat-associated protein
MRRGSGSVTWLLGDHLGSPSVSYDGVNALHQGYKPWGETRFGEVPTPYQFTGQYRQASLGLDFFNARWYDPALSRFTSADSIIPGAGQSQAWDRYAAMGNNPVKYVDPTGHAQACADGDEGRGCGSSGSIPDKEKLEIIRKERKESADTPFDASLGGNRSSKLTTTQKVGKGITYMTVMVFIVFPTEVALIGASITAAAAGPEGVVVDALLLPLEITVADFGVSYGIKTYKEIESGQNVEFTWTILPAIASGLPSTIQKELHNTFPRIFP